MSTREDDFTAAMQREELWERFVGTAVRFAWKHSQPYLDFMRANEGEHDITGLIAYLGRAAFLRAVEDFDPEKASFETWLFTKVRSEVQAYLREARRNRSEPRPVSDFDELVSDVDVEGEVVDRVHDRAVSAELRSAIDALDPDARLVIHVGYWMFGGERGFRQNTEDLLTGADSAWTHERVRNAFDRAYYHLRRHLKPAED